MQSSSTSLIELARRHDPQAWERLISIYGPIVLGWGIGKNLQESDAADVMQSVFLAVALKIKDFEHDKKRGSFRGWLWTIFRSKFIDFHRERKASPIDPADFENLCQAEEETANSSQERDLERIQLLRETLKVIRGDFKKDTWEAFWRSAVLNHRTRDIAADLSMTPQAVCAARARVLRRLREMLDGLDVF